ncbi:MAG: hypothetical protein ACJ790_11335 [Myxococcaceae bacterium]
MATEVIRRPDEAGLVPSVGVRLGSSLAAGQLAGIVMAVVMVAVYALILGEHPLYPVQVIASILLGHDALVHRTAGVLLTGVLFHQLVPCLLWSVAYFACVMFARLRMDLNRSLMLGFLIGLISEIIDVYLIAPVLLRMTAGENLWMMHVPRFWDWAAHAVYGLALGFFYWAVRNAIEKRRGVDHVKVNHGVTADSSGVRRND